ncbi:MAG: hypothetical protein Q7W30_10955, partial [Coriobacteriia bacterium]|nr:hypothetical protein [Coriobacteriia bacterium]
MTILAWGLLLVSGVTGGGSLAVALVVPRRSMWMTALVGLVSAAVLCGSVGTIWWATARFDASVAATFIAVGALLGGFALAAAALPSLLGRSTPVHPVEAGPDDGLVHVILLADAEPDTYSPVA